MPGVAVSAAVQEMAFALPVKIGDTLWIYTEVIAVGRASMNLKVEAWARQYLSDRIDKVTDAIFVMVALDYNGRPTAVPEAGDAVSQDPSFTDDSPVRSMNAEITGPSSVASDHKANTTRRRFWKQITTRRSSRWLS